MALLPVKVRRNGQIYLLVRIDLKTQIDEHGIKHYYINTFLVSPEYLK